MSKYTIEVEASDNYVLLGGAALGGTREKAVLEHRLNAGIEELPYKIISVKRVAEDQNRQCIICGAVGECTYSRLDNAYFCKGECGNHKVSYCPTCKAGRKTFNTVIAKCCTVCLNAIDNRERFANRLKAVYESKQVTRRLLEHSVTFTQTVSIHNIVLTTNVEQAINAGVNEVLGKAPTNCTSQLHGNGLISICWEW